jgi:hypothetical protein
MVAFADDTNLLGNESSPQQTVNEIINKAQDCFTTWNELLYASGHFMELEKCACYLSVWDFQEDGYAFTKDPESINRNITVKDIHGNSKTIKLLPATTSQKLLGSMKNPIGNQQDEVQRLHEKSNRIATSLNAHAISRSEAKMVYESFYLPAMRYSLSITAIDQMDFETIQRNATTAVLSALGFNRHMPREVVYGSQKYQGLGLRHLYDIQGSDGIKLLIQEINNPGSSTAHLIRIALETVQLEAGIHQPILMDNKTLPYLEWGWIPSIRDFLLHINARISNATKPGKIYRINDEYLMDLPILKNLSFKEQTLTDSSGRHILCSWLNKHEIKNSRSTKLWPKQLDPGDQAWKIWRNFITKSLTDANLTLRRPLGAWILQNKYRQYDSYWDPSKERLLIRNQGQWESHNLIKQNRRKCYFNVSTINVSNDISNVIPLDIISRTARHYVTGKPPKQIVPKTKKSKYRRISDEESVDFLKEESEIRQLLAKTRLIDAATDGSHDPSTGKMAYGWVIAIGENTVATGNGPAAGHPSLSSAFRAEAYGLWSMATFLCHLSDKYQISSTSHKLFVHLDNKALIGRMDRYGDQGVSAGSINFPDADVTIPAYEELKTWTAQLQHVKSHNKTTTGEYSFPEKLNRIADELARDRMMTMKKPLLSVQSPLCLLQIKDTYVTRDIQKHVLNAASKAPIQQFLSDKNEWHSGTFDLIHWELQEKILNTYDRKDQQRILKFVHEWLPTNHRLQRESQSTTARCPLCYYRVEDNMHLFNCSHPKLTSIKLQLIQKISQSKTEETIKNLSMAAVKAATLTPNWQPTDSMVPSEYKQGVLDQNKIGWHQIIRGRFAISLSNRDKKKEQDLRQIIRLFWDTLMQLWSQRNEIVHNNEHETQVERNQRRMEAKINRCYMMKDKLQFRDREKVFTKEKDELLREDTMTIKNWLRLAEKMIRISKREEKTARRTKAMMEQYFKWHPPDRKRSHTRNSMGSGSTIHVG